MVAILNPFDAGGYSLAEMTEAINILPNGVNDRVAGDIDVGELVIQRRGEDGPRHASFCQAK